MRDQSLTAVLVDEATSVDRNETAMTDPNDELDHRRAAREAEARRLLSIAADDSDRPIAYTMRARVRARIWPPEVRIFAIFDSTDRPPGD
jgi:hypothetical protein